MILKWKEMKSGGMALHPKMMKSWYNMCQVGTSDKFGTKHAIEVDHVSTIFTKVLHDNKQKSKCTLSCETVKWHS